MGCSRFECSSGVFSETLSHFLDATIFPVVSITLSVISLVANTGGMVPHTLPQCFLATLASDDLSWSIMFITWEVMALGIIIVLFDTWKSTINNKWRLSLQAQINITMSYLVQKTVSGFRIFLAWLVHDTPYSAYILWWASYCHVVRTTTKALSTYM